MAWPVAAKFVAGGIGGGLGGTALARRLSSGGTLRTVSAGLIFAVVGYVLWRSAAM